MPSLSWPQCSQFLSQTHKLSIWVNILMAIFLFCSLCALRHQAAEGTLPPNLFPKGPTYGIMCAHMQQISSLPCQPSPMYIITINFMHLLIYTWPTHKWWVWRLHQAIIPFPWISYISEWQIDKNLAPQGWWGDPLSLSDRHFSWQEGVKWAELARLWGVQNQLFEGQSSDRQAAVGRRDEVEHVQCSASLCITLLPVTHSSIPSPLDI